MLNINVRTYGSFNLLYTYCRHMIIRLLGAKMLIIVRVVLYVIMYDLL